MIWVVFFLSNVFFFQAEDGIRDTSVTGVQTCALPIYQNLLREPRFLNWSAALEQKFPGAIYGSVEYLQKYGSKDRKSTRLNSSHRCISYAVFCLKKKRTTKMHIRSVQDSSDENVPDFD